MSCKKADCNGKPIPRGKYCEIHRTKQRVKKILCLKLRTMPIYWPMLKIDYLYLI